MKPPRLELKVQAEYSQEKNTGKDEKEDRHRLWAEYVHERLEQAGIKDLFSNSEEGSYERDGVKIGYTHNHISFKEIGVYNFTMGFEMYRAESASQFGRFREWFYLDIGGNEMCTLHGYVYGDRTKIEFAIGLMKYVEKEFHQDEKGYYKSGEVVDKIIELLTCDENLRHLKN